MGLRFAVLTAVARDDLPDGGAAGFAAVDRGHPPPQPGHVGRGADPRLQGRPRRAAGHLRRAARRAEPQRRDGARLQRAVRPSAAYARSLAVLARAKAAGLTTKSGLIVGLGETRDEVEATLADLAGVGVDIVTIGQYLRPTAEPPARRALVDARRVRRPGRGRRGARHRPRRGQPAHPVELPRPPPADRVGAAPRPAHSGRMTDVRPARPPASSAPDVSGDRRRRGVHGTRPSPSLRRGVPRPQGAVLPRPAHHDRAARRVLPRRSASSRSTRSCPASRATPRSMVAHPRREPAGHRERLAQRRDLAARAVARVDAAGRRGARRRWRHALRRHGGRLRRPRRRP